MNTLYKLFNTLALTAIAVVASAQTLSVQDIEAKTGEQKTLTVSLSGAASATAMQFNLQLPTGLTANTSGAALGAATDGHTLSIQTLASGDLLCIIYSMDMKALKNGELLNIPVTAGNNEVNAMGKLYTVRTSTAAAVSQQCSDANFNVTVTATAQTEKIKMAVANGDRTAIGYSSSNGLDFTNVTDVKAWIVSGFTDDATVLLSRVKIVPPNTGLYLTSDVAGVEVDVPTTDKDIYYANLLKAAVTEETIQPTEMIDGVEYTNFVVGKLTNGDMGFVRVKAARTLGPNKSRLLVPSSYYPVNAPSLQVEFVDETATNIKDFKADQQPTGHVFDLQGRKLPVDQARKGLYIYKAKKYVIK